MVRLDLRHGADPWEPPARRSVLAGPVVAIVSVLLALLVATFAALTGIKPKDSRPVAHTRLMRVARFVLVVAVLIVAYMAFRARSGG